MRLLTVSDGGAETALETYAHDHLAMCRVADSTDCAELRVWRSARPSVSLGRYHRRPLEAADLVRRVTGGRPHGIGPGIVCMTGVYPSLDWLSAGRSSLSPEQVLNRALRPLLAVLREHGVDAFYPGRDLVTVARRPIVVASFTTLADGVMVVTAAVAAGDDFTQTADAIRRSDPAGIVTFDADALTTSTSLDRLRGRSADIDWSARLAAHATDSHACRATALSRAPPAPIDVSAAFDALQAERGPAPEGSTSVYGVEMLGAVEVNARLEGGRVAALALAGDLIAPFATLEELAATMIGERPTRAVADRALLAVLARPGRYLLGARDLADVVARLT